MNREVRLVILVALVVLGGWLRFSAIGFGLPDKFRPDEDLLVTPSVDLGKDWNPRFHDITPYPAAQIYLLHVVLHSYAMVSGSVTNLPEVYAADGQLRAYLIGREVSAAMGTAAVAAAYWAAGFAFGPTAALASAAIVAVSGIHVRESKFAKMQVPSGFWLVLAVGMMLRIARRGRPSDYALAGFFSALSIATAYQSAPIVFGLLAAHLESRHRENRSLLTALADSRIYLAGFVTLLTFSCVTPYTVLNPHIFRDYELLAQRTGQPGTQGWWYLLFRVMPDTLGIELLMFLLLAVVWVMFHPRVGTPSLLALLIITFLGMTVGHPLLMYRYAVNPLLVMALLAGILAADLVELASRQLGTRWGIALAVALFALLLTPSVTRDMQLNRLLDQPDTRALARLWIRSHVPPTTIAATDYDPIWNPFGKPQLPFFYRFVPFDSTQAGGTLWVFSDSLQGLDSYSPGPSSSEQAILDTKGTLLFDINPIKDGTPAPVFDPNDAFYVPFQHISSMTNPGPRIRIWMLKSK